MVSKTALLAKANLRIFSLQRLLKSESFNFFFFFTFVTSRENSERGDFTGFYYRGKSGFQLAVKSNSRFLIFGFVLLRSVHG